MKDYRSLTIDCGHNFGVTSCKVDITYIWLILKYNYGSIMPSTTGGIKKIQLQYPKYRVSDDLYDWVSQQITLPDLMR